MNERDNDVLDEGLHRLAATGPEFGGGLANHGPMAAEAMIRLGRADAVERWLDGYIRRLDDAPRPGHRITSDNWRDGLGDLTRVADWEAYFREELAEAHWGKVLDAWWTRLAPGLAAGSTHGIIRTSHAARGLAAADAAGADITQRRGELARGLAYWAARYTELAPAGHGSAGHGSAATPSTAPRAGRTLDVGEAVRGLPRAASSPPRGIISDVLRAGLVGLPGFGAAVAVLGPPADVSAGLGDLAAEFTRLFLAYGRSQPIGLLHAVTAPVAARSVLPLLSPAAARLTWESLWRVDAALYAVYSGGVTAEPLPVSPPATPDDLADRAVATGDAHAIKLTEASLRLHAEHADPGFLNAAARGIETLGGR